MTAINADPRSTLLVAAAATGPVVFWPGGIGMFTVVGIFGGATVTLQYLAPDNSTWVAAGADTTLTAAGNAVADLPRAAIQAAVSNAGVSTSLTASIEPVQQG